MGDQACECTIKERIVAFMAMKEANEKKILEIKREEMRLSKEISDGSTANEKDMLALVQIFARDRFVYRTHFGIQYSNRSAPNYAGFKVHGMISENVAAGKSGLAYFSEWTSNPTGTPIPPMGEGYEFMYHFVMQRVPSTIEDARLILLGK